MFIDRNNPNDVVQKFCKENNIEYSWDWNNKNGVWNEILFEGVLLMQITQGITLDQFFNVIQILSKDYYATYFPDDGIEFTVCIIHDEKHRLMFSSFLEKHKEVFKLDAHEEK